MCITKVVCGYPFLQVLLVTKVLNLVFNTALFKGYYFH
jgi:hypothetical protein